MQALRSALEQGTECALYLRTSACFAFEPGDRRGAEIDKVGPCFDFEEQLILEPLSTAEARMSQFGPQIFDYPEQIELGFFKIAGLATRLNEGGEDRGEARHGPRVEDPAESGGQRRGGLQEPIHATQSEVQSDEASDEAAKSKERFRPAAQID